MRVRLLPYRAGSRSASALANALGIKRLRLTGSRFRSRDGDVILNWGQSQPGVFLPLRNCVWLNDPLRVARARDKLLAYQFMSGAGVAVPEYTDCFDTAAMWLRVNIPVLARHTLTGQAGAGIEYYSGADDYNRFSRSTTAPMYVKYVPKYDEYRVHVVGGKVIDVQQKRTRSGEDANYQVRNAANGWVFCRENVYPHDLVTSQAVAAVAALGLDFGAVDIGWTRKTSTATVYEVNTAPGLEGTTLERYAAALDQKV